MMRRSRDLKNSPESGYCKATNSAEAKTHTHLMRRSRYLKNSPESVLRFRLTMPSQSLLGADLRR